MFNISNKKTSLKIMGLAFAFVASVLGGVLFSSPSAHAITQAECAAAKGKFTPAATRRAATCEFASRMSPADQLRSYAYFNALTQCIRYPGGSWQVQIPPENISSPKTWIGGVHDTTVGYLNEKDGKQTCQEMIIPALTLWGYSGSNYQSLLVDMGYTEQLVNRTTTTCSGQTIAGGGTCTGGSSSSTEKVLTWVGNDKADGTINISGTIADFQRVIAARVYGGPNNNPTLEGNQGLLYYRAMFHIENASACSAKPYKKVSELSAAEKSIYKNNDDVASGNQGPYSNSKAPKDYLIINIVNPKGGSDGKTWVVEPWVYKIAKDHSYKIIALNEQPSGGSVDQTCIDIARSLEDYAKRIYDDVARIIANGGDPLAKYGAIVGVPGATGETDKDAESTEEGKPTCVIEAVGWIVCPVVNFLAGIADGAFGFLADNFLRTDPQVFNTTSPTYTAWTVMRTFANVAFVIVFLIIIFSQLTGAGITNYGVKKMLPRLVIAAILVNISYFVCQIAVDISNILGYSLKDLFAGLGTNIGGTNAGEALTNISPFAYDQGFSDITGGVLAAAGIGVALYALLSTLIPVILAAVVALVMILFILVARQALIILLIVISPLAFVAFLLPNTENLFTQWRKALTAMLLLFPIIALVFGASTLASTILSSSFTGGLSGDPSNWFGQIAAAGVLVLPLFVVPTLLKKSLDGIPAVGKFMSGLSTRANANLTNKAKESYASSLYGRGAAIRKQARQNFRDRRFAESVKRGGLGSLIAGGTASLGITAQQVAQKEALARAAQGTAAAAQSEAVKQEMMLLQEKLGTNSDAIKKHIQANHRSMTPTQMEGASDLLLSSGGVKEYREIIGDGQIMATHGRSLVESGRRNEGEVRKKAADVANWMGTAAATLGGAYDHAAEGAPEERDAAGNVTKAAQSYIEAAYSNAEAGKLITMDPGTAELAETYINPEQAYLATQAPNFGTDTKPATQAILRRVAARHNPGGGLPPGAGGGSAINAQDGPNGRTYRIRRRR